MYRAQLEDIIKKEIKVPGRVIELTNDSKFGDYTTNLALKEKRDPRQLVHQIQVKVEKKATVEVASNGLINFRLTDQAVEEGVEAICRGEENLYFKKQNKGKKLVIEFSSPNIAKPFSVGHLRSTIIGQALANIYHYLGWQVVRLNFPGDWGTQIGKLSVAILRWGNETAINKNPARELYRLYVRFHEEAKDSPELEEEAREWFFRLESKDPTATQLWQKIVKWNLGNFDEVYGLLGVKFDGVYGESFFEDKMPAVITQLRDKKLLAQSEGAEIVKLDRDKLPPGLILKSDGSSLYLTRDLASMQYRLEHFQPDKIIVEAGQDQTLHFRQLEVIARRLGWLKAREFVHVSHGLVRGEAGKLSTRRGQVIFLEDLLSKAIERAAKVIQNKSRGLKDKAAVARAVGIGAVIYNDLKQNPGTDIVFNWDKMLATDGNSGPYLQYTHARAYSILTKAKAETFVPALNFKLSAGLDCERELARQVIKLSDYSELAANNNSPNLVADYLYKLADHFNNYYAKQRIIGSDQAAPRLKLVKAITIALARGLNILGIDAPDRL